MRGEPSSSCASLLSGRQDVSGLCSSTMRGSPICLPDKREYLSKYARRHIRYGLHYLNPTSVWSSHILLTPKPNGQWRPAVDYVRVNKLITGTVWPMPRLHEVLYDLRGSKYFMSLDFDNAYFQVPLAEDSQEVFSQMLADGIYTPTRLPQGVTDATLHFQACVTQVFYDRLERFLIWLDDILLHARDWDEYFSSLEFVLSRCCEVGLYLSPRKTTLFATEAEWCGRRITAGGVELHPRLYESLVHLQSPITADDLSAFLGACNWMRNTLPTSQLL